MEVSAGDVVELEIERVAHGGVFVASLAGRVVFVADTMPGERVLARITDDAHARFLRADTLAVLRPDADRRPHLWREAELEREPADRAGGAEFGHIAPTRQRELKSAVLRDALLRIGHLDAAEIDALDPVVQAVEGEPDGGRSRTRIRLHAAGGLLGPYAARTRTVVPVSDLPLGTEAVAALLPAARAAAARAPRRDRGARRQERPAEFELVAPSVGEPFVLGPQLRHRPIEEQVAGRRFALEAAGFWQVHPAAPAVLSAAVRRAAGDVDPEAANLDLYGGVGLLGAALADAGGGRITLTTVEADTRASGHAASNLRDAGAVTAVAARVEAFLGSEAVPRGAEAATVVLDPPRSGAGRGVVDALAERSPARIVYVACDPVALARDLALLAEHGYRPETLEAFDLFPNTHHLEAVAALARG